MSELSRVKHLTAELLLLLLLSLPLAQIHQQISLTTDKSSS